MPEAFKKITAKYNLLGFWGICNCLFMNIFLNILWLAYHFEKWHVSSSFAFRTYKKVVVDAVNGINPETVIELGCGLGEIIGRTKSRKRIGLDIDARVLSAAKFLYGRKVEFQKGSFEEISNINEACLDALIMCNWIHNIDPKSLRKEIEKLLKKKSDDPTPSGWTRQRKSGWTLSPAYWLAVRRSTLRLFHHRTLFFPFSLRELSTLDTE